MCVYNVCTMCEQCVLQCVHVMFVCNVCTMCVLTVLQYMCNVCAIHVCNIYVQCVSNVCKICVHNMCAMCMCNVGGLFPHIPVVSLVGFLSVPWNTITSLSRCAIFPDEGFVFIVIVLVLLLWRATSLKSNRMTLAWVTVPVGWRYDAALFLYLGAECHSSWLMSWKKTCLHQEWPQSRGA